MSSCIIGPPKGPSHMTLLAGYAVQAFLSYTSQEAFADRIGAFRMIGCMKNLNRTRCRHTSKTGPKFTIVITEQIPRCLPIGRGFSELLRHPGIGRGTCDADMDHTPCPEFDEEEREERSKEEISHLQEVTGPDIFGVVAQERRPILPSWSWCAHGSHVLLNGPLAHMHAEFQQFPTNPLSSPQSILRCHLPNQGNGFCSYLRRIRSSLRPTLPGEVKKLPMPTQQRLWLNNQKGLLPCLNQPGQHYEEHAIGPGECWTLHLSTENDELLA